MRQSDSPLGTAPGEDRPAVSGCHSLHKAVNSFTLEFFRLIRSFHFHSPPSIKPAAKGREELQFGNIPKMIGFLKRRSRHRGQKKRLFSVQKTLVP